MVNWAPKLATLDTILSGFFTRISAIFNMLLLGVERLPMTDRVPGPQLTLRLWKPKSRILIVTFIALHMV